MSTNFETISWHALSTVSGGKASSTDSTATALAGIQDSLKSLSADAGNKKSGLNDPAFMLVMCMALSQKNQGSNTTVVAGGGGYAAPAPGYSVRTRTTVRW